MARWSKGTFDHDGDGKPGGSRKADGTTTETKMAKAPKKAAAKPAAKPTIKADGQNQMNSAAAEQAEAVQKDSKSTAQTGMEPGPSPKEQREEINRKFEKADEEARQAIIDETQVGLQVRGY